jgi:hypothetical protein
MRQEQNQQASSIAPLCIAPLLFTLAIWSFYCNHETVMQVSPRLFSRFVSNTKTIQESLPPVPQSIKAAWRLGELRHNIKYNIDDIQILWLKEAESILSVSGLKTEDLDAVYKRVMDEDYITLFDRVKGFFSFVNLMWFVAILGITITIGPTIYLLSKPLTLVLVRIFTDVIIPTLQALKPAYEYIFYGICFLVIADSSRFSSEFSHFIALSGLAMLIPCMIYSGHLHPIPKNFGDENVFVLANIFLAINIVPIAILHNSQLVGFMAVAAFYTAMGFNTGYDRLCYSIGFGSKDIMIRVVLTSFTILTAFTTSKAVGFTSDYLSPFTMGISTAGSIAYFLGMLIMSSAFYQSKDFLYWQFQVMMIVSLVSAVGFGSTLGMNGMTNTGITFSVLYAISKPSEIPGALKNYVTVYLLLVSVCLYFISMYLHTHPGFIVSMFTSN